MRNQLSLISSTVVRLPCAQALCGVMAIWICMTWLLFSLMFPVQLDNGECMNRWLNVKLVWKCQQSGVDKKCSVMSIKKTGRSYDIENLVHLIIRIIPHGECWIPVLPRRAVRHRKGKKLAQGLRAATWWSVDAKAGGLASEFLLLAPLPVFEMQWRWSELHFKCLLHWSSSPRKFSQTHNKYKMIV